MVSPSAFPSYCTLYFSITWAFPFNCRSISEYGRNFSLASWQRRESEQSYFSRLDNKGGNSTEVFIIIKNWDPQARVALIFLQLLFLLTARATVFVASRMMSNYQLFTALFSTNGTQRNSWAQTVDHLHSTSRRDGNNSAATSSRYSL